MNSRPSSQIYKANKVVRVLIYLQYNITFHDAVLDLVKRIYVDAFTYLCLMRFLALDDPS